MRARPEIEWRSYNVTARDIAQDSSFTVSFDCMGCRSIVEFNIWKVGAVLADTPLQRLRFRCHRCGVYPTELKVGRRTSCQGEEILTVKLEGKWDEGHHDNQRRALALADQRWKAKVGR